VGYSFSRHVIEMSLSVPGQLSSKERRHLKQLQEVKTITKVVIQADDVVFEDGTTVESATSIDAPVTTSTASNTYQYIITDRGITDAVERVSSEHISVNKNRTDSVNESGDGQVITYGTDGLPSSDLSWCLMAIKGAPNSLTLPDQSTGSFPYANAATPITDESAFLTTNTAIEVRKAGVYEIEANNLWQLDTTTPTSTYTANTAPDNRVTFDGSSTEGLGYYDVSGELTAGSAPYASGSTGFTFMAWVYRTTSATGQYDRIVDFNNGTGTGGSGILYAASPVVYWWDYPASGNSGTYTAAPPYNHLSNNTWVHVCITHTSAGVLTDYRDGASVGSIGATYQSATGYTNKWLGKSGFTGQPNFTGQMADVIMLNSALTTTELSAYLSTNTLPTAAEIIMRYPTPAATAPASGPAEIATQVCVKRSIPAGGPTSTTTVRDILSEPWMKVQQVNPGTVEWHQGDDNLQGTQLYNTSDGWAIPYDTTPFTHFLFAHLDTDGESPRSSGPFVVMTKDEARSLAGGSNGVETVDVLYACLNDTTQVLANVVLTMLADTSSSAVDDYFPFISAESIVPGQVTYNNNIVFGENAWGSQTDSSDVEAVHAERGAAVWIVNNPNFNRYASVGPTSTCLLQEDFPLGSTRVSALTQCAPGDKIGMRAVGLALETAAGPAVTGPAGRCSLRISRVSDHFSGHLSYYSDTPFPTILNSKFEDVTHWPNSWPILDVHNWTRTTDANGNVLDYIVRYTNITQANSSATPYASDLIGLRGANVGLSQTISVKIGHTYEVDIKTAKSLNFNGTLDLTVTGGTISESAEITYSDGDIRNVVSALTFTPDTTSVTLSLRTVNGETILDEVVVRNTTVCVAPLQVYKGLPEGVPLANYTDTPLIDVQCMPTSEAGQAITDASYPTYISGARDYYVKAEHEGYTPDVRVSLVMVNNPGETYTGDKTTIVLSDTSTSPPTLLSNASDYYEVLSGNLWDGLVRFKCGPGLNAHSILPGISTGVGSLTETGTIPSNRLTFDGTNHFDVSGELTGAPYGAGSTGFTFMAWVYRTTSTNGSYDRIVDFNNGDGSTNTGILYSASPVNYWWSNNSNHRYLGASGYTNLPNDTWVHVCITHTDTDVLTEYRDGSAVGSQSGATYPDTTDLAYTNPSYQNYWLGKSGFTGQPNFEGQLADVIMLNTALTASELNDYISGGFVLPATPIMRYPAFGDVGRPDAWLELYFS